MIASSGVMAFTITTVGIKQMQRFGNTISVWLRGQGHAYMMAEARGVPKKAGKIGKMNKFS